MDAERQIWTALVSIDIELASAPNGGSRPISRVTFGDPAMSGVSAWPRAAKRISYRLICLPGSKPGHSATKVRAVAGAWRRAGSVGAEDVNDEDQGVGALDPGL